MTRHALDHLETLRRRATTLAITRHALRALAVFLLVLLGLSAVDFLLRFPAPVRLVMLLVLLGFATRVVVRLIRPANWQTSLARFALAIERQAPMYRGRLAAAVELASSSSSQDDPAARALQQRAIEQLDELPSLTSLKRLYDLKPLRIWSAMASIAIVIWLVFALLAPSFAVSAVTRWLTPWAAGPWPTLISLNVIETSRVRPLRSPLHITVETPRSSADRRVLLSGQWLLDDEVYETHERVVMNRVAESEQAPARFEAWLQPPAEMLRYLEANPVSRARASLRLETGWDHYPPVTLNLAPRPRITQAVARVTPPAYARDAIEADTRTLELDRHNATVTAHPGSQVEVILTLSREVDPTQTVIAGPDLSIEIGQVTEGSSVTLSWTQPESMMSFTINALSADGLGLPRAPTITLEPDPDQPPTVRLVEPSGDLRVMPQAVVSLHARATDDIALGGLALQYERDGAVEVISESEGPAPTLELVLDWPLEALELSPGQSVTLVAVASDTYQLGERTHEPVRSTQRRIIIVDQQDFTRQMRQEVSLVEQRITRALAEQRRLQAEELETASVGQQRLAARLSELARDAAELRSRARRNRLEEESLNQLLNDLAEGLQEAADSAASAHEQLDQAETETDEHAQVGREAQARTAAQLQELSQTLDDSSAALKAVEQAQQLAQRQQQLAQRSAELLPQTLGRNPEDLPVELREQLEDLARQQDALAQQTREAAEQWRQLARELSEQQDNPRASELADALQQAAQAIEQQQIPSQMDQAGDQVQGNRMASANSTQQQISQQLQEIAEQLEEDTSDAQQQDLLAAIVRELHRLLDEQTLQRENTDIAPADALPARANPARVLRLQTLTALEQVEALEAYPAAESSVRDATVSQATAITALRASQQDRAVRTMFEAENALQSAIETLQQQLDQQQADDIERQREELQAAYRELAERQREIRRQTLTARTQHRTTQRRIALANVADTQWQHYLDTEQIEVKVANTTIFGPLHERLAELGQRITRQLRAGYAANDLTRSQEEIAVTLDLMADALDRPYPEQGPEEDGNQPSNPSGQGQAQQQEQPLILSVAELQLLRGVQLQILNQTTALQQQADEELTADQRDAIQTLGIRQRELARLGEQLLNNQNQQQP